MPNRANLFSYIYFDQLYSIFLLVFDRKYFFFENLQNYLSRLSLIYVFGPFWQFSFSLLDLFSVIPTGQVQYDHCLVVLSLTKMMVVLGVDLILASEAELPAVPLINEVSQSILISFKSEINHRKSYEEQTSFQ